MKVSPSRFAAFSVLLRIETERSFSSVLLPIYESELSGADSSLCHELVLGTLRRQMYLDRVIDFFSKGRKIDDAVRIALRLGLYQLIFLDKIPAYSAVNDSVGLIHLAKKTSAKGFVNAILRRASKVSPEIEFRDDAERLSVNTSHPRWLIENWIGEFGFAEAEKIAEANNKPGGHAFRFLDDVQFRDVDARPSEFVDGCYLSDKIDTELLRAATQHTIYFQDEASQMIACSIKISNGGNFLDVCAAPGGKTGLVISRNVSNLMVAAAGDLHWQRVMVLRDNCRLQGVENVQVLQYNAEKALPFANASFDTVLVDAPCSGTGTIRHNPELRYFICPEDISDLSDKQLRILNNASKLVKHGGSVVYSTCSLEREENERVAERFLSDNGDFRLVRSNVPDRFITGEGFTRTFPHRDGMDGFFIGEFRRH